VSDGFIHHVLNLTCIPDIGLNGNCIAAYVLFIIIRLDFIDNFADSVLFR
jgi:hypothetical protein